MKFSTDAKGRETGEEGPGFDDHIVILDDSDTYSGASGCVVRLDGREYNITMLLDFYLIKKGHK